MWHDRVEFDRNFLQNLGNFLQKYGAFLHAGGL
jgi:hypothetical protein